MTREIDEAIERYTSNAEYERTHGNLQGYLEFKQLAEWLKDYKRLKEQPEITWVTGTDGAKVAFLDVPIPKVLKICEILQEPTVTSTNNSGEMIYPQVDGITPTVVEPIGDDYKYIKSISNPTGIEFDIDIDKKVESYGKLLKHPVVKHIMDMDETQESCDVLDINDGKMSKSPTDSKDVIWYSKRNYSEIVVEPQERSDKE